MAREEVQEEAGVPRETAVCQVGGAEAEEVCSGAEVDSEEVG